jgi:hypothetical protein
MFVVPILSAIVSIILFEAEVDTANVVFWVMLVLWWVGTAVLLILI